MSKRLELEALQADLALVNLRLSEIDDDDVMGRNSFSARKRHLESQIAAVEHRQGTLARVALVFGGKPVIGARAINAEFATDAVSLYQDLVGKVLSSKENGQLAQSGPIPGKQASRLNITGIVHGSFGFILEEDDQEGIPLFKSCLAEAIDISEEILSTISGQDEAAYSELIERIDPRTFNAIKKFYSHIHGNEAALKIYTEKVKTFDSTAIERGYSRVNESSIDEDEVLIHGVLLGVTPMSRRFDLRVDDGSVIMGKVGPSFSQDYLKSLENNKQYIGQRCDAGLLKKLVKKTRGREAVSYTLMSLAPKLD